MKLSLILALLSLCGSAATAQKKDSAIIKLADIKITGKKPLIENRIDRTIINVDASITNIGTTALEVLEKSPGVTVDRDGNISLKGKEGVLIMIDGRPTQLGGADLASLLRSMSSSQLDQIEIMTNPPARYDAAGTSGIINLKTKKILKAGINGSVSLTYSQGRYPKTNEGFNFNYREGKINLFTNLSHNYQKRFITLNMNRNIFSNGTNSIDKIFSQDASRIGKGNAYSAKVGVDFFANKQTTVGAVVNLNSRHIASFNPNVTNIMDASKTLERVTNAFVDHKLNGESINTNLYFRNLLDKKGKEITADIDFIRHGTENNMFMVNSYFDALGYPYSKADTLLGLLPQHINVYSARIDYLHPLKNNAKLEAGIKSGLVRTDNNAGYDSIQHGNMVHDFNRSNHFIYEENINAVYLNLSTTLAKKINAQFGLRMENTNAKGSQKTTGENFDRHYTQLFPTAYFQYKANNDHNFGANFGRRVRRPNYQFLNPFIRFTDRYTYNQGNPNLKPATTNNIEFTHAWKNQITTTLNYSHVKDMINEIVQQKGQEAYFTPANVASFEQFGIAINANNTVNKWWTSSMSINVFNDSYKGLINGAGVHQTINGFVLNGTQQFKINKTLAAEINGLYRSSSLEGLMRIRPYGVIGAGISQQILDKKATIRLTARDIFHTQKINSKSQYANVDFDINQLSDTQIISVGFSYNFSRGKKSAPVKRTGGSAVDEQGRIGQ